MAEPSGADQIRAQFEAARAIEARLANMGDDSATAEMASKLVGQAYSEVDERLQSVDEETRRELILPYVRYQSEHHGLYTTRDTLRDLGAEIPEQLSVRLEEVEQGLSERPDLQLARRMVGELALDELITVVPPPPPAKVESTVPAATPEGLSKPEADKLTINIGVARTEQGAFLKISKRYAPLSKASHEGQRDYSAERLAAVHYLITNKDREIPFVELWQGIYSLLGEAAPPQPYESELSRQISVQVRNWLTSQKYWNQNLIIHNGLRGPSSKYSVNPALRAVPVSTITEEDIRDIRAAVISRQKTIGLDQETIPDETPLHPIEETAARIASIKPERLDELKNLLPTELELGTLFTSFTKWYKHKEALIDERYTGIHQLLEVSAQLEETVRQLVEEATAQKFITNEQVDALRIRAYEKMRELAADETKLNDVLTILEAGEDKYSAILYSIIETIMMFGDEEDAYMQQLFEAQFTSEVIAGRETRGGIDEVRHIAIINGNTVYLDGRPATPTPPRFHSRIDEPEEEPSYIPPPSTTPLAGSTMGMESGLTPSADETVLGEAALAATVGSVAEEDAEADTSEKEAQEPADAKHKPSKEEVLRQFRQDIGHALDELYAQHVLPANGGTINRRTLSHMANSAKMGTSEAMERLQRARIINREQLRSGELEAWQVVASYLLNTHRDLLSGRRGKPMHAIVKEATAVFLDKKHAES